jgi:hypothetical protein
VPHRNALAHGGGVSPFVEEMIRKSTMGYQLTPIAVDIDALRLAIGSGDAGLVGKVRGRFYTEIKRIDRLLKEVLDPDEEPLTTSDLLRQLILGEPRREDAGFGYGYCLELICRQIGQALPNSEWSAMHGDWFDAVAAALRDCGVNSSALAIRDLAFRGSPVPLPPIDDFPGIGYLTAAEIGTARAALAAADLSRLDDEEVAASIRQVQEWLNTCADSNRDLVCFYA